MAVADADGGTRAGSGQEEALQTINSHGEGDVGMVIEFNSGAEVRQTYTTDIEALRRAVERASSRPAGRRTWKRR